MNDLSQNRRKGLTSNALPKVDCPINWENIDKGVSTRYILSEGFQNKNQEKHLPQWYALRCTYGQEKKAYEKTNNRLSLHPAVDNEMVLGVHLPQ